MQALIIAGGQAQRLRPLTDDRPKAMIAVAGKPILEYQVEWLRDSGVSDLIVACGYRHGAIEDYFGDGSRWHVCMRYSVEETPLGRGGALRLAYKQVSPKPEFVIATNGDNIHTQAL